MQSQTLYQQALHMLETTNPYSKPVSDLCYTKNELRERISISLLSELEKNLQGKRRSTRGDDAEARNRQVCYDAIKNAMIFYIEEFQSQSYSYKQTVRRQFGEWIKRIAETYEIPDTEIPDEFKPKEADTAIAMIKQLQKRKGVTVNEMREAMDMTHRAVQKNLKKIDSSLNDSKNPQPQFRIGGQPVDLKITTFPGENSKGMRYRTSNTMHPLVLLENQMQIGVLLQSLAHNYWENDSDVSYSIGLDIWCQLSDYAKERVNLIFAANDSLLRDYIEQLESAVPDSDPVVFETERKMLRHITASNREMITFVMKANDRRCNLVLRGQPEELMNQRIEYHRSPEHEITYTAISEDGNKVEFTFEDIEDIEII